MGIVKSFSILRSQKIIWLINFVFMLLMIGTFVFVLVETAPVFPDDRRVFIFFLISPVFILFLLLLALRFGLLFYASLKSRLVFKEHSLEWDTPARISRFLPGYFKPFVLDYARIKMVSKGRRNIAILDIVDMDGRVAHLAPLLFGKEAGDEVLAELRRHLVPECFDDGLEIKTLVPQVSRGNKVIIFVWLIAMVVYLLPIFFLNGDFRPHSWLTTAWKLEHWPAQYERAWAYSVDGKSGFWVLASRAWNGYRAYHYPDGMEQVWDFPRQDARYPTQVSGDRDGQPIIWMENASLHYRDGKWSEVAYQGNLISGYWDLDSVVVGEQGWMIGGKGEEKRILRIDALSGQETALDLPADAVQQGLSPSRIRRAMDGALLVMFHNENSACVYLLAQDQWQAQRYPVSWLAASGARDFFLDADGALWVLFETDGAWQVEKAGPGGEFWVTGLPDFHDGDGSEKYDALFVDAYQRLWVAGYQKGLHFMAVFAPGWKGNADELQRYTSLNSNYQQGRPFTNPSMLMDGRIWAFGGNITSMDTNQQELPVPLPEWFVVLAEQRNIILILGASLQLLLGLWSLRFTLRSRRPVVQKFK